MWSKVAQFLGYILAELFEPIFKQWREPPEVREVGGDAKLRKEIDDDIKNTLRN